MTKDQQANINAELNEAFGGIEVTRDHWVITFAGMLHSAFSLTETEQYEVVRILNKLFTTLNIPERGVPTELPLSVAQEVYSGIYSNSLTALTPPPRKVTTQDCIAPLEAWRNALENMVVVAYPTIDPVDRLLLIKTLEEVLKAVGVPNRAAVFLPDPVLSANRDIEDAQAFTPETTPVN